MRLLMLEHVTCGNVTCLGQFPLNQGYAAPPLSTSALRSLLAPPLLLEWFLNAPDSCRDNDS
uniref:Uncharacterized protein n=1 Tax=Picea glauca TaxID=3330 RepID=A0A101LTT0_PICGL|nr:hypothetical protein ABT39_MTgene3532 [Picea glauca]KUM45211.1 hypothetical protein ABT39_MTgene3534 [Picea glauca]KUM45911.1 hypothetical protein ABT39_MTgene2265 [Picea glauca]QHR88142.1 hypothetical protein Q903MT_gene2155 [Picea sitchensis]